MRYMMLIYTTEQPSASPAEMAQVALRHRDLMQEAQDKGVFQGAEPLQPTSSATTIRMKNGEMLITDGPFAETKEQLAGYYILDCKDLDEALEWAARIPTECGGASGCVEIRPLGRPIAER